MRIPILAGVLLVSLWPAPAQAQNDRFGRFEPGLIVQTGGRMGACDVLLFTPDGKRLLAAGDDKIVPVWECTGNALVKEPLQVLRWSTFREQKGSIYAMALSPDDNGERVVIGGMGVRVGAAALLNRSTGEVERGLVDSKGENFAIWSLAFSPSGRLVAAGKGDGRVVVWDLSQKPDPDRKENTLDCRVIGEHKGERAENKVGLVAFIRENELVSVAEGGDAIRWTWPEREGKVSREPAAAFATRKLGRAAISPNRKLLAVINDDRTAGVEVVSLVNGSKISIVQKGDHLAQCLAFDATSTRLAVGTREVPASSDFRVEGEGKVVVYELKGKEAAAISVATLTNQADAVAFHPEGKFLAVAGGDNHEVTYWELREPAARLRSTIVGDGRCLWEVALSRDGLSVGFKDQRTRLPQHPNRRATGPWHLFNLDRAKWGTPESFTPVKPIEVTEDGWKVRFSDPASRENSSHTWFIVSPEGKSHPLTFDIRDGFPRCYTFLPPRDGKPLRLAVGHYWGASLFELTGEKTKTWRRCRLFVGHQGEVMGLGVSADQKLLVTAGRDMTIAAWSLEDWASHPDWGARFLLRQNKIVVDAVDVGSPAWDAGLTRGDEVRLFSFFPSDLYDPDKLADDAKRAGRKLLSADEAMQRLKDPVPNREFYFLVKREGKEKPVECATRILHRPAWRFLPLNGGEWVWWRWRDYYYDASTNGDSYLGWQVNGNIDATPVFYKAEQFRQRFNRPEKLSAALDTFANPEKVLFAEIEPPDVRLRAGADEVKDRDLTATLSARPRSGTDLQKLERVLLWVNDFHDPHWTWAPGTDRESFKADGSFEIKNFVIPRTVLRHGPNVLTLQAYNKAGGRGEALPVTVSYPRPAADSKLYGLAVGVGDYRESELRKQRSKFRLGDLNAHKDARAVADLWLEQKGKYFKDVDVTTLTNQEATPEAVLAWLTKVARQVRPDDRLVLFLGGHGTSAEELQRLVRLTKTPVIDELSPRSFAMLGPKFDIGRPNKSCLTTQDLYEAVTAMNCHKLILLDACHSGAIAANPVRELTRDGVGPVIVAACAPNEQAIEYGLLDANRSYGLFTIALRRTLDEEFADADKDHDGLLTSQELVDYLNGRVPRLVDELKTMGVQNIKPDETQTPSVFLPRLERGLTWVKN